MQYGSRFILLILLINSETGTCVLILSNLHTVNVINFKARQNLESRSLEDFDSYGSPSRFELCPSTFRNSFLNQRMFLTLNPTAYAGLSTHTTKQIIVSRLQNANDLNQSMPVFGSLSLIDPKSRVSEIFNKMNKSYSCISGDLKTKASQYRQRCILVKHNHPLYL